MFKLDQTHMKCRAAAPIRRMSILHITLSTKFKDFKDHFQNSRTFQGFSKIVTKNQGHFKDFKDQREIQGFQGFFQGCGNPVILLLLLVPINLHED